jgi:hypothetical protein
MKSVNSNKDLQHMELNRCSPWKKLALIKNREYSQKPF